MSWWASPYTGLVTSEAAVARRAHDPLVATHAARLPGDPPLDVGGAGFTPEEARAACFGEVAERISAERLPADTLILASHAAWPSDEPAVPPAAWVLFHPEQYALEGFPFVPFTDDRTVRWTCYRTYPAGEPCWVPDDFGYLFDPASRHPHAPAYSTGTACGRAAHPTLLRALQEVVERDAVMGAWFGRYLLEEHPPQFSTIPEIWIRPNLTYRFYRVRSPHAAHVTMVTALGEDLEGAVFSIGSACRETRAASWEKSLLECIQGRHHARWLKRERGAAPDPEAPPASFADHAVYYSWFPERLARTPLANAARAPDADPEAGAVELAPALAARLAPHRIYFRNLTAPCLVAAEPDLCVLRVVVPGLQPLHGHHLLAHLGGPLWAPRGLAAYASVPPHPFP